MWHWRLRLSLIGLLALLGLLGGAGAAAQPAGFSPSGVGSALADSANGRMAAQPTLRAHRANHGEDIRVDGKLDDTAWLEEEAGRGFRVWDPDRGAIPLEETVFKVAYDDGAIYFAVACLEKDPSKITAKLSRRDRFSSSDIVSVYIDPYHDQTTGYNFKVNPLGVQADSYIYNDGERDDDWDAVWEAGTSRDSLGWYAEIRVPFSAIRYRAAPSMTWGLQVYRYMHGRGQDTAWLTWDRATHGFVSRFGTLTGLEGIRPPRQIEILPYVVGRMTDPALAGSESMDDFQNFGMDLKYGITPDLTLNATIQPDFGQVEADPAVLNLSPFEILYAEKRPFFIEGSRFFQHPDFNLFYSRRIGTGEVDSRIRYAAKLTGKMTGGVSVAAMAASTDITEDGQAFNFLKTGAKISRYFVGRFGKEFSGGKNRFNLMQTATQNTASVDVYGPYASRESYTTGADFDLNFRNREYNIQGSFVGSIIDPETTAFDSTLTGAPVYGTGGALDIRRRSGKLQGGLFGRWESDKLELNDLGYLQAPDEMVAGGWMHYPYNPEGKSKFINRGDFNFEAAQSWLYAGRTGYDASTGAPVWSYGPGHQQFGSVEANGWMQFRNYREAWGGLVYNAWGTQRYETRGGPLMSEPLTYGGWLGFSTDTRKDFTFTAEGNYFADVAHNHSNEFTLTGKWNQSSALNYSLSVEFQNRVDDTQYLDTVNLATDPGGTGIGGYSYVFGDINQNTLDLVLRANILFSRNQSLEVYAQPYTTAGDYSQARELIQPDTYDLVPYSQPGFAVEDFDFTYASVNLNVVYRWEYRPGSTFFLVWTQNRTGYDQRSYHNGLPEVFNNDIANGILFGNEPENTLLAKVTYWIAI